MTWKASLGTAIRNLRAEEQKLERDLTRVRDAIRTLDGLDRGGKARRGGTTRRVLSPKGREAISRAARKRWAKWRAEQKKS